MLSKPLAYPSTLDHRPPDALSGRSTSYVEELWSPSLAHVPEIGRQKPKPNTSVHFFLRARGVFLPQAGPRFDLVHFKLSITSSSYRSVTS